MVLLRLVGREIRRGQDRADEEPGAELARDEIGVLALPAEPCLLGERLFHQRGGVDEDLHLGLRLDARAIARGA